MAGDRKKLTFYFTAEKRVDFRTLVRELASMFRTRIELKQIGVRDEAKRLDGIGRCGRQYCSSSWLPELRPVNLGVAKDQRLSLNPSQISGACGRLMCCLRYEHEFYVLSRKRFPKEGKIIRTTRGEEKVISNDIFRERVTLRGEDGELRVILLAELRAEAELAGVRRAGARSCDWAGRGARCVRAAGRAGCEDDELTADEALDTEHSPDHVAIGTTIDPAMDVTVGGPPRASMRRHVARSAVAAVAAADATVRAGPTGLARRAMATDHRKEISELVLPHDRDRLRQRGSASRTRVREDRRRRHRAIPPSAR
jgi:hypothetical protein